MQYIQSILFYFPQANYNTKKLSAVDKNNSNYNCIQRGTNNQFSKKNQFFQDHKNHHHFKNQNNDFLKYD